MIHIFFQGVVLGLIVSITAGPAFITIVQTGIQRGFTMAFFTSIGVLLSDATLIAICYLGTSIIFSNPDNKLYIGLVGGIILVAFGIWTFQRKPEILMRRSSKYRTPRKKPGPPTYFFKGFFLNFLNPFILLFWLTAMSWVTARAEEGRLLTYTVVFFSGALGTIFALDMLKSHIGQRISNYFSPRKLLWINRGVGIALIVFGIMLIIRVTIEWI